MTRNARGGLVVVLGFVAYLFARPFMPWGTAALIGILIGVATAIVSRRWLVAENKSEPEGEAPTASRHGLVLGLGIAAGALAALATVLLLGSQPAGAVTLAFVAVGLASASAMIWQRHRAAR